jgi:hypothetical protein
MNIKQIHPVETPLAAKLQSVYRRLLALKELLELVESDAPDGYYTEHPSISRAFSAIANAEPSQQSSGTDQVAPDAKTSRRVANKKENKKRKS